MNPSYATCDLGKYALLWRRYQVEEKHCTPCFGYNLPHLLNWFTVHDVIMFQGAGSVICHSSAVTT